MQHPSDYHFGLDADLDAKKKALYDHGLEADIKQWMESVLGTSLGPDFIPPLQSGVVLCELGNKIKPGSCKAGKGNAPFIKMENINSFLNFCKSIGVATTDLFMTVDLYESKNPNQVLQTLSAVKRIVTGAKPTPVKSAGTIFDTTSSKTAEFCSQCGNKVGPSAKFCGGCGNKI